MRRYALNPCDYLYHAQHDLMRRRGLTGSPILMVLDLAGTVDPARLSAALDQTIQVHPVLRSRARRSLLAGKPYWAVVDSMEPPVLAVRDVASEAERHDASQDCLMRPIDPAMEPPVRVELLRGPAGGSRLCFTWPHALMDAEGGQWFVHEIDRMDRGGQAAAGLRLDDAAVDPLAPLGLLGRLRLARRGLQAYRALAEKATEMLGEGADVQARWNTWRFAHRAWSGKAMEEIRRNAARWCPNGPARFGRYLAGCVLRALWRTCAMGGVSAERLLITLPMRAEGIPAQRPMRGNHLVSATLYADREFAGDKQRLMDQLARQIEAFGPEQNRANWAMLWLAARMRAGQYRWMLGHPRWGYQPYASGFSYYGEIDPPMREFLGTRVENFWGTTTMPAPPGWNPAFARFADRLNFVLSWLDGHIGHATAQRYADLIEAELFDRA